MLYDTRGTTSLLWVGLLALMAGGVALAANAHLDTDGEGEESARGHVHALAAEAVIDAAFTGNEAVARRADLPAAPSLDIRLPQVEFPEIDEATPVTFDLRKPAASLPPISADANALVERLLAVRDIPRAPAPIAVATPRIQEPELVAAGLEAPELQRPPLPDLPAIRP